MVRLRCKKHGVPLDAFDGGPYFIPRLDDGVRNGSYQAKDGIWEIDLSNVQCPKEITEWVVEADTVVGPGTGYWVVGNDVAQTRIGPFTFEDAATDRSDIEPLDECVQEWAVEVAVPVLDTGRSRWIELKGEQEPGNIDG